MINNRQNGRRRGRGGGGAGAPRPNGGNGGGQDRGNRIDNRARGNAAQLHEKYKALARDAQMQGDRVNTEYYLQFADHYFRVLAESRSRFEETQPRPRRDDFSQSDEDYGDEGERMGDEQGGSDPSYGEQDRQRDYEPREERAPREDRAPREAREPRESRDRGDRNDNRERGERGQGDRVQNERVQADRGDNRERNDRGNERGGNYRDEQPRRPRRDAQPRYEDQPQAAANEEPDGNVAEVAEAAPVRRRARAPRAEAPQASAERIDMDVLPPSFSLAPPVNDAGDDEGEKPRRRTRKPRGEEAAA